jgi:hypothetical protein
VLDGLRWTRATDSVGRWDNRPRHCRLFGPHECRHSAQKRPRSVATRGANRDHGRVGWTENTRDPLLVTLFVESAVRRTLEGRYLDDMPEEVPEIFVDHLRRLNVSPHPDAAVSDDAFIRAAQTVATVSLGKNLVPQDFTPQEATEALKKDEAVDQSDLLYRSSDLSVSGYP